MPLLLFYREQMNTFLSHCCISLEKVDSEYVSQIIPAAPFWKMLLLLRVQNFPKLHSSVALLVTGMWVYFCKDIAFYTFLFV